MKKVHQQYWGIAQQHSTCLNSKGVSSIPDTKKKSKTQKTYNINNIKYYIVECILGYKTETTNLSKKGAYDRD